MSKARWSDFASTYLMAHCAHCKLHLRLRAVMKRMIITCHGHHKQHQACQAVISSSDMAQVEKLLTEVDTLEAQHNGERLTPEALDSRTRLYERVASEVSRLKYFLAKGQHLPSLQQLQPRADSAVKRLSSLLRQALDTALRGGHQSAALHCLQAYAAVGDTAEAEQVTPPVPVYNPQASSAKWLQKLTPCNAWQMSLACASMHAPGMPLGMLDRQQLSG